MFVTNWILTTKIQKISEITNFFRHYFLSRTEVNFDKNEKYLCNYKMSFFSYDEIIIKARFSCIGNLAFLGFYQNHV